MQVQEHLGSPRHPSWLPQCPSKLLLPRHSGMATSPWFLSWVVIVECPSVASHPLEGFFLQVQSLAGWGIGLCVQLTVGRSFLPHQAQGRSCCPCIHSFWSSGSFCSGHLLKGSLPGTEPWGLALGCWCNEFHQGLNYVL